MLYPTVCRHWDGVSIEGQHVGLQLHPRAEGTISVTVIALAEITGFARPCRLSSDEQSYFATAEIQVHDTRLECFATDKFAPILRTGFTLDLEPGMAQQLRAWLPRLTVVALAAQSVATKFSAQLRPPIYHMLSAITAVVARIVLNGWDAEHSVAYEREHGIWFGEREFMAQFDAEGVMQELRALVRTDTNPTQPVDGA